MGKTMPSSKAFPPQLYEAGHDLSDNDLLEATAGGDRDAFAILMKIY